MLLGEKNKMIKLRKVSTEEQKRLNEIKKVFNIKTNAGAVRKLIKHGKI